ncbi:hypothetical protein ACS0TY_026075 [Phlomoides rotata]
MQVTYQTSDIEDYVALYEKRIAQLPSLPSKQYLGMFLGGLQTLISDCIPDYEMMNVFAAIKVVRRITRANNPPKTQTHSTFSPHTYSRPPSSFCDTGQQSSNPSPNNSDMGQS